MINVSTIGVIGNSSKRHEKRSPIHPEHICDIAPEIRSKLTFEAGYGEKFGVSDELIARQASGRVASRQDILATADCIIIPKPIEADLKLVKNGAIIWGWSHCVQQHGIAQLAIDKNLTLISWEAMFSWGGRGDKLVHTFQKNNEIAGYAAVNHASSLVGSVGIYGKSSKIIVLSFGSVSRGAIYALKGQGHSDITVLCERPPVEVGNQIPGVKYQQMVREEGGLMHCIVEHSKEIPLIDILSHADIIVNGTLQNTNQPKYFVTQAEANKLKVGCLIIDISCDEGMGFWCAKPTSFDEPMFEADGKNYYSVDHIPTLYWNSASWEISKAALPYIAAIAGGESEWQGYATLANAIEIKAGQVINHEITTFQKRSTSYPYNYLTS